jgi:hypothetical protein
VPEDPVAELRRELAGTQRDVANLRKATKTQWEFLGIVLGAMGLALVCTIVDSGRLWWNVVGHYPEKYRDYAWLAGGSLCIGLIAFVIAIDIGRYRQKATTTAPIQDE